MPPAIHSSSFPYPTFSRFDVAYIMCQVPISTQKLKLKKLPDPRLWHQHAHLFSSSHVQSRYKRGLWKLFTVRFEPNISGDQICDTILVKKERENAGIPGGKGLLAPC